jgi:hypothetical protein
MSKGARLSVGTASRMPFKFGKIYLEVIKERPTKASEMGEDYSRILQITTTTEDDATDKKFHLGVAPTYYNYTSKFSTSYIAKKCSKERQSGTGARESVRRVSRNQKK